VIDVGCGVGTWVRAAKDLGVADTIGIDGACVERASLLIPPDEFLAYNLERERLGSVMKLRRQNKFDLVMSLEVAEHLSYERGATFVADLAELGDVVLFSAAIPFQGGEHHQNEQWPEYWAILFRAHGYTCYDFLRRRVWERQDVAWWYAQNALVFVRSGSDAAKTFADLPEAATWLAVVHPQNYLDQVLKWHHTYCGAAAYEENIDFHGLSTAYAEGNIKLPPLLAQDRALATPEREDIFPNTRIARSDPDETIRRLRAELEIHNARLADSNLALTEANIVLTRSNDLLTRSNDLLTRSNDLLTRSNDLLTRRIEDAETANKALVFDLHGLQQKFMSLCEEVEAAEADRSHLSSSEAQRLVDEVNGLRRERDELQRLVDEVNGLRRERDELANALQYQRANFRNLAAHYEGLRQSRFIRVAEAYYRLYSLPVLGTLLSLLRRLARGGLRKQREMLPTPPSHVADGRDADTPERERVRPVTATQQVVVARTPFDTIEQVDRILVVKLDHTSDFVLGFPAFKLLRQSFLQADITLLCGPWNLAIAETSGCFDRIECLALLPESSGDHHPGRAVIDEEKLRQLKLPAYDIAVDFRDHYDTNNILGVVEARFRAAFYAHETASLMDLTFPSTNLRMVPGERIRHQVLQTLLAASIVAVHTGQADDA
jgi:hypothetical protein